MLVRTAILVMGSFVAASPQVLTPPKAGLEQTRIDKYRAVWFYTFDRLQPEHATTVHGYSTVQYVEPAIDDQCFDMVERTALRIRSPADPGEEYGPGCMLLYERKDCIEPVDGDKAIVAVTLDAHESGEDHCVKFAEDPSTYGSYYISAEPCDQKYNTIGYLSAKEID